MFGMEGWVILMVATLGTFVVMHLWVASLSYEFGLRRSVGARRRDLLRFVLSRAAGVAVGGVAIGLWVGLFVWGALATVVAAFAGALHPAWQAARTMPSELIRTTVS